METKTLGFPQTLSKKAILLSGQLLERLPASFPRNPKVSTHNLETYREAGVVTLFRSFPGKSVKYAWLMQIPTPYLLVLLLCFLSLTPQSAHQPTSKLTA